MKHFQYMALLALTVVTACNVTPVQTITPTRVLGRVELSLDSGGVSSLRASRVSTLREADVVFGTGTTQVITTTNDPYNYLVATFPVSHSASSTSAFNNLTLYAEVLSGNIGNTAINTITNFGGVTNSAEQVRLAKLVAPVHAVTTSLGNIVLDNAKADFQAFTNQEVSDATALASPPLSNAMTASDSLLNYGFSARCDTSVLNNCTLNSRLIALNKKGSITVALRVPKSTSAYKFLMNFIVMDENVSRVTRSLIPNEDVPTTETRGSSVSASELMQFGLHRETPTLSSVTVDDVSTSSLGASIFALGIGRISAGDSHSCGLDATGTAYCWGDNTFGKLGNGSTTASNIPVAVSTSLKFSSIVTGDLSSCALSVAGDAYCWGSNFAGRLGNNSFSDSSTPVLVSDPLAGSENYSSISASNGHTCTISLNGDAYCWGDNGNGRLGDGTTTNRLIPTLVSGTEQYSKISAGYSHTCAIAVTDLAYCWGKNDAGQLGNAANIDSNVPVLVSTSNTYSSIAAGNDFTCAALSGSVGAQCWGVNNNGQLGTNPLTLSSNVPITVNNPSAGAVAYSSIVTGGFHTCAISVAGDAYCWGINADGETGTGTNSNTDITTPTLVSPPSAGAELYSDIEIGTFHSCAISTTGKAYCWGLGSNGRLGYNSTADSNIPTRDAATSLTL